MSTAPTNAHTHIHHTHIHHTNTQIIIRGLRQSLALAVAKLNDLSIVTTDAGGKQAVREVLEKCAGTALNSKLIAQQKARALFVCVWGGGDGAVVDGWWVGDTCAFVRRRPATTTASTQHPTTTHL